MGGLLADVHRRAVRRLDHRPAKFVASTPLRSVDQWSNSTLVEGSVADFVDGLRRQEGGTIGTAGSPTMICFLVAHRLLDEPAVPQRKRLPRHLGRRRAGWGAVRRGPG
ncbi:MAG: hypothetical protein ABR511_00375 [Acidimicrobiales bacterium]